MYSTFIVYIIFVYIFKYYLNSCVEAIVNNQKKTHKAKLFISNEDIINYLYKGGFGTEFRIKQ